MEYSTDFVICPHCKHEHKPDEAFFFDEDFCEFQCHSCNKEFLISTYVSWSWTTRKQQTEGDKDE